MARWISLSLVSTGFIFSKSNPSYGARWEFISETVAIEIGCDADDLDTIEDEDGREFVTLHGTPVVEIHYGFIHNLSPSHEVRRAA